MTNNDIGCPCLNSMLCKKYIYIPHPFPRRMILKKIFTNTQQ